MLVYAANKRFEVNFVDIKNPRRGLRRGACGMCRPIRLDGLRQMTQMRFSTLKLLNDDLSMSK